MFMDGTLKKLLNIFHIFNHLGQLVLLCYYFQPDVRLNEYKIVYPVNAEILTLL